MGNTITNIGDIANGHRQRQQGRIQINERLTWLHGPPHDEVRRFAGTTTRSEPLLLRATTASSGSFSYTRCTSPDVAFADFLLDQVSAQGERLAHRRRGRTCRIASRSMPRTTSRSADNLTLNLGLRWATRRRSSRRTIGRRTSICTNARSQLAGRRTATAARSTSRTTRAGSHGSASPTARASAGCSAAATASRSTWKAPAPTCACRSTRRSSSSRRSHYDRTSGAGTIATGFEGLQALDRPSGQLRAWDPEPAAAAHAAVEPVRAST